MIHLAILALALLGFALLHAAMPRHQQDWLGRKFHKNRGLILRRMGFAALVAAFLAAGFGLGWAVGAVVWCGWLTAAAATVVTTNLNRERILARLRK